MAAAKQSKPSLSAAELEALAADSEQGVTRRLTGWESWLASALCASLSLYALYWTQFAINTSVYRATFLGIVLAAAFVIFPIHRKLTGRHLRLLDAVLIALSVITIWYFVSHLEATKTRATAPLQIEIWLGGALMLLVLEATRRATGWALPLIAIGFLVYGYFGPYMPEPFNHRGFSIARIVGQNYLTLEGLFSTPMDVAATFIIVFALYGAVLDRGGAGRFFIDWAFALFGKRPSAAAPGRAVVASGFLLGTVSGSGIATTVTLSSLSWPLLKRSGYTPTVAGGLTSAAGIGATLSPPTLGAAAFIIAEYLEIDYVDVLIMAAIPTVLYYLSCWFMVEGDARKLGVTPVRTSDESLWGLTTRKGYHFISLAAIAVLLATGMSAFLAVFWSIIIAFALSMIRAEDRLLAPYGAIAGLAVFALAWALGVRLSVSAYLGLMAGGGVTLLLHALGNDPDRAGPRLVDTFVEGGKSCVGIAATCATAGIIVSIINLSGLGLKLSGVIVDIGGGNSRHDPAPRGRSHVAARHGGAGDRFLHHCRRGACAGPGIAGRGAAGGPHVHVLLCGAGRRLAANRAIALRGRRHLRRRAFRHHDAGLEVHAPGLRGSGHLLPAALRHGAPAGRQSCRDRAHHDHSHCSAGRPVACGRRLDAGSAFGHRATDCGPCRRGADRSLPGKPGGRCRGPGFRRGMAGVPVPAGPAAGSMSRPSAACGR